MPNILFIDGTKGFHPSRLSEKPTGGILTSLTLIPQFLAAQGHSVTVLTQCPEVGINKGVAYTNSAKSLSPDVVVFNRNTINWGVSKFFEKAKKIWWLHDIVDYRYLEDNAYTSVDKIVALSRYNVESYSDYYGIDKNKFDIIPNGVDDSFFYRGDYSQKDPNLYICASAPVKGLYPIEFSFYNLKRHNPNIKLRLYSSQSLHDLDESDGTAVLFDKLKDMGAEICQPIPQKELADVMRKAWCLLMPNHYPEICSNLLLQAQACGLPVISVPIGSVPEFITHRVNGLLTKTFPHDMFWWWKDYAQLCIEAQDKILHKSLSEGCKDVASWQDIGLQWNNLIGRL